MKEAYRGPPSSNAAVQFRSRGFESDCQAIGDAPYRLFKWFPTPVIKGGTEDRPRARQISIFSSEDREDERNLRRKDAAERLEGRRPGAFADRARSGISVRPLRMSVARSTLSLGVDV
jgi:hypothetical protein